MRVVLCNGCFDLLHYGHLVHLREAKSLGERLVVSVTGDESVRKEKGEGRPVFRQSMRADFLRSLRCVDEVVIVSGVMEALETVNPDVFVKGPDYAGSIGEDVKRYCLDHGVLIHITSGKKYSSAELIRELGRG